MAPPIAFAIPFFLAYRQMGLIDTVPGLIIIYLTFNLSLVIWMMRTFFEGLPRSLEEAAYIDGAGITQTFLRVTLPLSAPGILAGLALVFIPAVGEYVIPELLGGPSAQTLGRALWNEFFANRDWPMAAALATALLAALVVPMALLRARG